MVKHITPQELAALIKSETEGYLVVDVRDDDYRGGNIKGAMNIPSEEFMLKLHQLIGDTQNVSKVVFHCTLSQQRWVYLAWVIPINSLSCKRGPKAARVGIMWRRPVPVISLTCLNQIYTEARLLQEGATDVEYEVFVLKGGFADFQRLFRVSGLLNY